MDILVDPKRYGNTVSKCPIMGHLSTGIGLIFSNQNVDILGLLAQICGKETELEDLGKRSGKSSLF